MKMKITHFLIVFEECCENFVGRIFVSINNLWKSKWTKSANQNLKKN